VFVAITMPLIRIWWLGLTAQIARSVSAATQLT
jgi:hypothetical protein